MSSNKHLIAVLLISSAFLVSCGSDEGEPAKVLPDFSKQEVVLSEAKKLLGENVGFAQKGYFLPDSSVQIAAAAEIETKDEWGIRFYLLKLIKYKLEVVYESEILQGSLREAMINKFKFPDFRNELIYYNSRDYFIGSGGGEIFSYIVDFEKKQIFYSHLFSDTKLGISLYISENVEDNLRNFFVSVFRRDYPDLKIAIKDVDLQ